MKPLAVMVLLFLATSVTAIPLHVDGPPAMDAYLRQIESIDTASFASLLELTGAREPQPSIQVVLAPERSPIAASAPPWVSGWASGDGPVVLIPSRARHYPDGGVEELLRHELAHVLASRVARGSEIPRWFDEGLAMYASRGWQLEDRSRLAFAMMRGDQTPLTQLDTLFAAGETDMALAYAISGAFVRDLILRQGRAVPGEILHRIGEGESFPNAFVAATGESLADAEAAFWRRQTLWSRWVPLLTSTLALWLFITLLALWAIGRRRAANRLRMAEWDGLTEANENDEGSTIR